MQICSSARRTGRESRSTSEWTMTQRIPISRQARMMRSAISPRLAIKILRNINTLPLHSPLFRGGVGYYISWDQATARAFVPAHGSRSIDTRSASFAEAVGTRSLSPRQGDRPLRYLERVEIL